MKAPEIPEERDVSSSASADLLSTIAQKAATGSLAHQPAVSGVKLKALLACAAAAVPNPRPAQKELVAKLAALVARLDEGVLRVTVLGQFKRGKSTLLNALLGAPALPIGVIPVTAIPAFIKAGAAPRVKVSFRDAGLHSLDEGQKVSFETEVDRRSGKLAVTTISLA